MAVNRPPLLDLGGEESFAAYQAEFDRVYRNAEVVDVLGQRVLFRQSACWHVCFKPHDDSGYSTAARSIWSPERALRLLWILPALTDPGTEVRPNVSVAMRLSYLLIVSSVPDQYLPQEYYVAITEPGAAGTATFVTAFPIDRDYWQRCRKAGRRLYPEPKPRRASSGRRR